MSSESQFPIGETFAPLKPRTWFERHFWFLAITILVAAIASRFYDLAGKPFHHDESLHAYYSHVIATGGSRDYDPLLHGPFLYYFVGTFQRIAGWFGHAQNDFVARFPAAFFGVLVVAIPLLIRKLLGSIGTLTMMFFLLISPTTLYFGRFLREDVFTSIWVLGTLFGVLLTRTLPDNKNAELHLGSKLQIEFPFTPKTGAAIFASSMLAFHFTNKENSFLHTALWCFAVLSIILFENILNIHTHKKISQKLIPVAGEPLKRALLASAAFVIIFVLFFSSFFRHSEGWWNGVIDGLYRKSLLYWWQQDQQRRIDGPFDYHLPLIANYEFLLLPFLALAWTRLLVLSRRISHAMKTQFALTKGKLFYITLGAVIILIVTTFFAPRVPLVAEGCSFSDTACTTSGPLSCHGTEKSPFCFLHISHTRHLLQIISYIVIGGIAFLASLHVRRRIDAFLWFWLTGALGTYSYVGEKVPWLVIYIILPLLLIAALEAARILGPGTLPADTLTLSRRTHPGSMDALRITQKHERKLAHSLLPFALLWLTIAVPFTLYKSWRVAWPDSANPNERLVFTQTTPIIPSIRDRWLEAQKAANHLRVAIDGDATWPMAWYALPVKSVDFVPTAKGLDPIKLAHTHKAFHAMLMNERPIEQLAQTFPDFNIYRVPLRAWWVPLPNPSVSEIFAYFFRREIYPALAREDPAKTGKGSSIVLYLESRGDNSPFLHMTELNGVELVARAEKHSGSAN